MKHNTLIQPARSAPLRLAFALAAAMAGGAALAANTLTGVSYTSLPGNIVQVTLRLADPATTTPGIFTIDDPARITLDLRDTTNALPDRNGRINLGPVTGYASAEAQGRTRVVINLSQLTAYETRVDGNNIHLLLGGAAPVPDDAPSPVVGIPQPPPEAALVGGQIINIDFQRGRSGEGLVRVLLPSARTAVDMRQQGDKLIVDLKNTRLPPQLQRSLDVTDFATPVFQVDAFQQGADARMEIQFDPRGEHLSYQTEEEFVVEVKPLAVAQEEAADRPEQYSGEKVSLDFQDIEVRSVLQIVADFTGLNIIVSDTVGGNVTLRLRDVPWDQALDIVLKSKGLGQRREGNVIRIAPAAEIANLERLELEAAEQARVLEPLQIEYLKVNYADVEELSTVLTSEETSLLDERGSVVIDQRTNTLIIRSTASQIADVRDLVAKLDVPVKQVLIESRIVSATDDFSKSLGVRFGFNRSDGFPASDREYGYVLGGGQAGNIQFPQGAFPGVLGGGFEGGNHNLMVDLPSSLGGASATLAIGKLQSTLLQLELSALQAEGRGEIISSPRLVTADKNEAIIKMGTQIPYQEASAGGAATTAFQDAVLSLTVTPQITPDDKVIMDLAVNRDAVGQQFGGGVPSVDTQSIATQVVVDNGETVVLGGVYERNTSEAISRVPFFSELPFVGWAFRNRTERDDKSELLIFVTPKIINEGVRLN